MAFAKTQIYQKYQKNCLIKWFGYAFILSSFKRDYFWLIIFYYLFILQHDYSFPSLLSSHSLPPPCAPSQPLRSLFLFKKGQALHGYQQNMTYQVVVRLRSSPCIKGNPVDRREFQEAVKMLKISPAPIVRSSIDGPSYIAVT